MTAPLPPEAARARAARLLAAAGLTEVARNTRGDSLYFRRADDPWLLRLSSHPRTPKQRRNHPEVAASLVIRAPTSAAQVDARVAAALRDLAAQSALRAAASAATGPEIGSG